MRVDGPKNSFLMVFLPIRNPFFGLLNWDFKSANDETFGFLTWMIKIGFDLAKSWHVLARMENVFLGIAYYKQNGDEIKQGSTRAKLERFKSTLFNFGKWFACFLRWSLENIFFIWKTIQNPTELLPSVGLYVQRTINELHEMIELFILWSHPLTSKTHFHSWQVYQKVKSTVFPGNQIDGQEKFESQEWEKSCGGDESRLKKQMMWKTF